MVKRIISYLIAAVIMFIAAFFLNKFAIGANYDKLHFSLLKVYLFHAIASILVYVAVEAMASYMPNNAGYVYLGSVMIKMGFFILLFPVILASDVKMEIFEKLSLVIPLGLYLLLEGLFLVKLLNNK